VDFPHIGPVFCKGFPCSIISWWVGDGRVRDVESVLEVTGGVLLGDEKGIKIPEPGFDKAVKGKS